MGRACIPSPGAVCPAPTPVQQPTGSLNPVCVCVSRSVVSDSLRSRGLQPARLLYPWNSPGKNTEVGCHCLLQGISGIEPRSLALQADSLLSELPEKPSELSPSGVFYRGLVTDMVD